MKALSGWKKTAIVGLVILKGLFSGASAESDSVKQNIFYNSTADYVQSETILSGKDYLARVNVTGDDSEEGIDFKVKDIRFDLGYKEAGTTESTRTNLEIGKRDKLLVGAGFQTKDNNKDFSEAYLIKDTKDSTLEAGINSDSHLAAIVKTGLNENNAAGIGAVLSNDDYFRAGIAMSHTGKLGLFGYVISGENSDGSDYTDIRLRGGLGGKTKKGSIGSFGVANIGIFDENLVDSITNPIFTGTFSNYSAATRGDSLGFDARYKDDIASLEVALKTIYNVTLMPQISYDTTSNVSTEKFEAHLDLGRGFIVKGQVRATEDSEPEYAGMVGCQLKF